MSEIMSSQPVADVVPTLPEVASNGDAAQVTEPAKKKKGPAKGSKKANAKQEWLIPDGGLKTDVTDGFNVQLIGGHRKLVIKDFADPLNFAKWQSWYYTELLERAESERVRIEALGATPEERAANIALSDSMQKTKAEIMKRKASGGKLTNALQQQLADLMALAAM